MRLPNPIIWIVIWLFVVSCAALQTPTSAKWESALRQYDFYQEAILENSELLEKHEIDYAKDLDKKASKIVEKVRLQDIPVETGTERIFPLIREMNAFRYEILMRQL